MTKEMEELLSKMLSVDPVADKIDLYSEEITLEDQKGAWTPAHMLGSPPVYKSIFE